MGRSILKHDKATFAMLREMLETEVSQHYIERLCEYKADAEMTTKISDKRSKMQR